MHAGQDGNLQTLTIQLSQFQRTLKIPPEIADILLNDGY
jgi:hypothetical protein